MMEQARKAAEQQAHQIDDSKARVRFIGDGVDWHEGPLNALQDLKLSGEKRPEPAKLQAFPDAVKWIGASDETPIPEKLLPPEQKSVATSSTSPKEELKGEPEPKVQALGSQGSRDSSEPQALAMTEHQGLGKASEATLTKAPRGTQSTQGNRFTGRQIAVAMMLVVALFAMIVKLSGAVG
jgi:hypothetical protein